MRRSRGPNPFTPGARTTLNSQDDYPLLLAIQTPSDLRRLPERALGDVARELRRYLVDSVSRSGGHFADAGLDAAGIARSVDEFLSRYDLDSIRAIQPGG